MSLVFFFFQAEDGIRDGHVTGVQTCALPISWLLAALASLAYGLLGTQQWRNLVAPSWDLGIFTQLAKAYGGLDAPIVPIKGDAVNLLGDHFHPILVLLAPEIGRASCRERVYSAEV